MQAPVDVGSRRTARAAGLIVPPLGLFLLWRSRYGVGLKVLGSIALLVVALAETALVIWLLIRFTGLEIEWRGGYLPALTYRKSRPDYAALERDRASLRHTPATRESSSATPYWTAFRGPNGDGHYDEAPILTNWPASGLKLLWRRPIGGGYSSFTVAEGLAFTLEQRREQEFATAYALGTGEEVWHEFWLGRFKEYYSEEGPRTTPVYSEGRLYALGALGELRCLKASDGALLWRKGLQQEYGARVPTYGFSASPLILGQKLILLTSAGAERSVVCCDKTDGKLLWSALDDRMGYATPIVATLAGEPQLIVTADSRVLGLSIDDGRLLWDYPWRVERGPSPIAQPVLLTTNRFLLSAGYFTGCAAVEVARTEKGFQARTLWQNKHLKNKFTSSVFVDGYVYGLDEDTLACLSAETGERVWREGRFGYGQLLLANSQHLVILAGDGDLALVQATPTGYHELGRFRAIRGKTWNHLAIAGGKVLVRNSAEMACFNIAD